MKVFGTDYDGVMINIEPQKAAAFGALASKRWRVDEKTAEDFWFHGNVSGRRGIFNGVYEQKFGDKISDEEYKFAENEFSELLKDKFYPSVRLLPGALDLIKFARTNFDRTFISSGVPMEEIKYLAGLNGIADYFDLILGTNDQFPTKNEHFNKINDRMASGEFNFYSRWIIGYENCQGKWRNPHWRSDKSHAAGVNGCRRRSHRFFVRSDFCRKEIS